MGKKSGVALSCPAIFAALTRLIGRRDWLSWPLVYNHLPLEMRTDCLASFSFLASFFQDSQVFS
jgi:hypothetical protein